MRTLLTAAALVITIGLAFAGCKKAEDPAAKTGGKRKIVIGMVAKSQSNAVFQAAYNGAKAAAKELGEKYNAEVTIDWRTPVAEDAQKQAEAIEALTRAGVDGITVACSEANTVTPAIDKAAAKNIPVMCFDSDAPRSKRFCYYGTDDADCGRKVMAKLAEIMGKKGTVAILAGNQSAPNLQMRVKAVREELAKYPDMKELNDGKGVFFHEETPEKAAEEVTKAQNANPSIGGWAMVGGWPLFTDGALKWEPGTVKVAAVDALPAQLSYVRSGHVEVLLAQDCFLWGYKSVEILLDKIVNGKDPASPRVIDPLKEITKANLDEWSKGLERWKKQD